MSDAPESDPPVVEGGGAFDADAALTGLLGGLAIPLLQFALWELAVSGPLSVAGAEGPEAEMALFVAIGVALPAGGIALLYEDDPVAGGVGAGAFVAGLLGVRAAFSTPLWFLGGALGAALLLGAVAVLEYASGDDSTTGGTADPNGG